MTAKELKKLKRSELLEILLARTEEVEKLKKELDEANKKLEDRKIQIENAGSIAEAALKINGIFEAAEQAAKDYLLSIGKEDDVKEKTKKPKNEKAKKAEEPKPEEKVEAPKPKRGRPKKQAEPKPEEVVEAPKPKRGRPKKIASEEASS